MPTDRRGRGTWRALVPVLRCAIAERRLLLGSVKLLAKTIAIRNPALKIVHPATLPAVVDVRAMHHAHGRGVPQRISADGMSGPESPHRHTHPERRTRPVECGGDGYNLGPHGRRVRDVAELPRSLCRGIRLRGVPRDLFRVRGSKGPMGQGSGSSSRDISGRSSSGRRSIPMPGFARRRLVSPLRRHLHHPLGLFHGLPLRPFRLRLASRGPVRLGRLLLLFLRRP
mmetsp:Transcript_36397/g.109272  ORF Transcript_36397/g.109272 Transcript_36397/m.109272 type:complete len:227 (+) Transcript_36397:289-969(+)